MRVFCLADRFYAVEKRKLCQIENTVRDGSRIIGQNFFTADGIKRNRIKFKNISAVNIKMRVA